MKVYVKPTGHLHEGLGPGFPDQWVVDGYEVRLEPFEGAVECVVTTEAGLEKRVWYAREALESRRDQRAWLERLRNKAGVTEQERAK